VLLLSGNDHITSEINYQPWTTHMVNTFHATDLKDLILGTELDDRSKNWQVKNGTAMSFIMSCVINQLLLKIEHCKTAVECWKVFQNQYHQIGMGSVIIWMCVMLKPYQAGQDITEHINTFKVAQHNLANAEFDIPDHIAAAMLVSTLPSDPAYSLSWNSYISSLKLVKTTTFNTTVNGILEESKHRNIHMSVNAAPSKTAYSAIETTVCTNGIKYCKNCKQLRHDESTYCGTGGAAGRKGQCLQKGKKGNEKVNTIEMPADAGKFSNFVIEQCFSITDFSVYAQHEHMNTQPSCCPPIILDSGLTTHIHSNCVLRIFSFHLFLSSLSCLLVIGLYFPFYYACITHQTTLLLFYSFVISQTSHYDSR
jgi:hypothetical protein